MKLNRFILCLIVLCIACVSNAQIKFTEKLPPIFPSGDFFGYQKTKILVGDVDGNGTLDVVFRGENDMGSWIGEGFNYYSNEGGGVYVFSNILTLSNICNGNNGDMELVDIDGDGDLDIASSGDGCGNVLYKNDGNGNYQVGGGFGFAASSTCKFLFGDLDNDNDLDVITYDIGYSEFVVFRNDGNWSFTEVTGSDFESMNFSVMPDGELADFNGDNYLDLVVRTPATTYVFLNNGAGVFVEDINAGLAGVGTLGDVMPFDMDNDGDQDILLIGGMSGWPGVKLYENDGLGGFTEMLSSGLPAMGEVTINVKDIDGDNDFDITLIGEGNTVISVNDGNGVFTEVMNTGLQGMQYGGVQYADVDGDLDLDLFMSGLDSTISEVSLLYENKGAFLFEEVPYTNRELDLIHSGDIGFLDLENDGDIDVLLSGADGSSTFTKLYLNDGSANFSRSDSSYFAQMKQTCIAVADIDGDNDQDVLMTGEIDVYPGRAAYLYINDGFGNFIMDSTANLQRVQDGETKFADIDGDGDQDLLITGDSLNIDPFSQLYKNDGNGNFSPFNSDIANVAFSSVDFFDVDNDSDLDLLITGVNQPFTNWSYNLLSNIYLNDGNGNYTLIQSDSILAVYGSDADIGDIDGDGDLDFVLQGIRDLSWCLDSAICEVYTNDGTGYFDNSSNVKFPSEWNGSVQLNDMDQDGDPDILVTGSEFDAGLNRYAAIYENIGGGIFMEVFDIQLDSITYSTTDFADLNNDGKDDFIILGRKEDVTAITKIYLNETNVSVKDQYIHQFQFKLYPNPSSGEVLFYIEGSDSENCLVQILTVNGELIDSFVVNTQSEQRIKSLNESGIYFIRIYQNDNVITKKIVRL